MHVWSTLLHFWFLQQPGKPDHKKIGKTLKQQLTSENTMNMYPKETNVYFKCSIVIDKHYNFKKVTIFFYTDMFLNIYVKNENVIRCSTYRCTI